MRHAAPLAAVLTVLAAPLSLAQELPAWAGHFVSEGEGDLELVLAPSGDLVVGALTRGASVFEVVGRAQEGGVEGTSRVFSDEHPSRRETVALSARASDDGAIALTVGGAETRLVRVAGSPLAADALVVVIDRLLSPGGVEENQASAVLMLSLLVTAQSSFHGEQDFATFEELERLGEIDAALARGVRKGYRFTLTLSPTKDRWLVTASPLGPDTGRLHFAATKDGTILESKSAFRPNEDCKLVSDSPTRPAGSSAVTTGLAHVRAGQRYTFSLTSPGGPKMEMVYTVKEFREGFVKYETHIVMDMGQGMAPVGEPNPMEWRLDPAQQQVVPPQGQEKVQTTREQVTISGLTFDCLVVTTGNTSTWVPMTGDAPTFPGLIKSRTDGQMTIELVRIE